MSPIIWISIAAFLGVAAMVSAVAVMFHDPASRKVEDRLDMLTGVNAPAAKEGLFKEGFLAPSLTARRTFSDMIVQRFSRLRLLFEQADTTLTPARFFAISGAMGLVGLALGVFSRVHAGIVPVLGGFMAILPLLWLMFRRRKRLKKFAVQLPDAMELIGRALRAGHSLAAGFSLVGEEMAAPIGKEFTRVFEEQNLGIPMEEALEHLTERVPNLDLKFFSTAVILQRQTGGDLAEILDKIGSLIRERFKIWGQVQALTGEGRLSGVVLMGLPVVLFLAVYRLNPDYVTVLFTDPMGKKMLAGAIFLQVLGALVIRKIVNIKV
ncbi:MAG: type II secretion system F family protein [Pirellulales bacterium]